MAFLGMRGTGDWVTDERPKSWREMILRMYPTGDMPLTGITAKMAEEKVDDPEFNWWTKSLPTQRASVVAVYTDSILSTAYVSGGVAGTLLYFKMSEDDSKQFRVGHQVVCRDASDYTVDVVGKVMAVSSNGTNSYVAVKLLEADDNSSFSHTLANSDVLLITGNINAEGAAMPTGISYDPVKYFNYTQIFRTPLSITRTAMQTKYRTGDKYQEMKMEALELHGIEMEKAWIWGIPTEGVGSNGKPERTTAGILYMLKTYVPANVNDYSLNSTYSGKAWLDDGGGSDWLMAYLEQLFRYGVNEKLAICGSGALLGLNKLAQAGSHMTMTPTTRSYGIRVTEWITPFGTLNLLMHPLFNYEATMRNAMLILEPKNLKYRYIQDTKFYAEGTKDAAAGTQGGRIDGKEEEYLTEAGMEFHHVYTSMFLNGVGEDSEV